MHAFSCFATVYIVDFKATCPTVKPPLLKPTRRDMSASGTTTKDPDLWLLVQGVPWMGYCWVLLI